MRAFLRLAFAATVALPPAPAPAAPPVETISAVAFRSDGTKGYTESHELEHAPDGSLLASRTKYFAPDRSLIATLDTRVRSSLAAADYTFRDLRDGSAHGVEARDGGFLVWRQAKDQAREERVFGPKAFAPTDLVVAGQGLFFHLRRNLEEATAKRSLPVKLLIPGRLDYFSFHLVVDEEDADLVTFRLRPDSLFVRLFVPALRFQLHKRTRELVRYTGPSNLVDGDGDVPSVEIRYETKATKVSQAERPAR